MRFLFFFLALTGIAAAANPNAVPSAKKIRSLYAWFDKLPLPDVTKLKRVRVWSGGWTSTGSGPREWTTVEGFLLKDDGEHFEVVLEDWTEAGFTKAGTQPETEDFVGYREISLTDEIRKLLPALGTRNEAREWEDREGIYWQQLNRTAQLFALARVCARRGDVNLAAAVFRKLPAWRRVMSNSRADDPLEVELEQEFYSLLYWRTVRAFQDQRMTRPLLLQRFRQMCKVMPGTTESDLDIISQLEKMIREDAAHGTISDAALASLPPERQAEEFAFRLRDERLGADEWPYAEAFPLLPDNGALSELKKLGFQAVPALIEALEDESATRGIWYSHMFGLRIAEVHDLALQALDEIAGFNFTWQIPNTQSMSLAEQRRAVRKEIEDWWKTVSQTSEKDYLLDKLRTSAERPEDFAKRLVEKYPETGVPAIIEVARASQSPVNRSELTKLLWKNSNPEVLAYLGDEILHGPTLGNRVAAAYGLRLQHDARAVAAMLGEWTRIKADPKLRDAELRSGTEPDLRAHVVDFLAASSAPEAVRALTDDWANIPPQWRQVIIEQLGSHLRSDPSETNEAATQETRQATEDALSGLLTDKAALPESYRLTFGEMLIHPRICDLAASQMHELWPDRYAFDQGAAPQIRDRACMMCRNVRLRELGEASLPLPDDAPDAQHALANPNLITAVEWEEGSVHPDPKLAARIEALRGMPLSSMPVIALLTRFATNPPPQCRGLKLTIFRYSEPTGVTIQACLVAGPTPGAKSEYGLSIWGSGGGFVSSGGTFGKLANPASWKSLVKAIETVRQFPTHRAYLVGVSLEAR